MDGLQLASRYWSLECRDVQISRLQKQKRAAHTQAYRLKQKLREAEIARALLLVAYLQATHSNEILHGQIRKYVHDMESVSTL